MAAALLGAAIATASAGGRRQDRVGIVLDAPLSRGDAPTYASFSGLAEAKRKLGIQAKAVVPSPTSGFILAPYESLARRQYNLVISVPFIPGLSEAAKRFSRVKFAVLDGTRNELTPPVAPNVVGTLFHTEEAAYLAGFVAAKVADKTPHHVVSTVGVVPGPHTQPEPQVQAYIAGFRAGARRADPKIKLLNGYSYSFTVPENCKAVALRQIARGSQVVFAVAGGCGIGALTAAKQSGVYAVGVDTDESALGKYILTSVVINWKKAVYDLAWRLVHRRLPAGHDLSLGMRDNFVGLGKFSSKVPPYLRRQLTHLARQIEQGKIVVPATLSSGR